MPSRSLGHRAPLLWLVLPLMAGLALGKAGAFATVPWLLCGAVITAVFAIVAGPNRPRIFASNVCLAMIFAGMASYSLHRPRLAMWDQLPPREARVQMRIDRTFLQKDNRRSSGLATLVGADEPLQELAGQRVYYSVALKKGEAAPLRSAVISAIGIIAAIPRDPPSDTFDGYLANAGINFRLTRGHVLSEVSSAFAYYRFCARQADRFAAILGEEVEAKRPALVGVFRAMMLGQQNELSEEQVTIFRETGTMHVFSISGLHIAVIATGLHALLSLFRIPRALRFPIGLIALWLYVDITGMAPSAVRSFVMVAVVEIAMACRLPRNPLSALAASALIILVIDPLQLFSASFQMSYGIVAALLLLGLPLADYWQERFVLFRNLPKAAWGWHRHWIDAVWRATLAATAIGMAASLVSAITGILFFNLLTPGAFLANLWLIPASSGVIYMGMFSLISGLLGFLAGSGLANHAALLILWVIDAGIRWSVEIPAMWFNASFKNGWLGPATFALLLLTLIGGYARSWGGWQRGYWAPFAVVTLTLVFAVTFN